MTKIKEIISLIKELRKHKVIRSKKKKKKTKKLNDKKTKRQILVHQENPYRTPSDHMNQILTSRHINPHENPDLIRTQKELNDLRVQNQKKISDLENTQREFNDFKTDHEQKLTDLEDAHNNLGDAHNYLEDAHNNFSGAAYAGFRLLSDRHKQVLDRLNRARQGGDPFEHLPSTRFDHAPNTPAPMGGIPIQRFDNTSNVMQQVNIQHHNSSVGGAETFPLTAFIEPLGDRRGEDEDEDSDIDETAQPISVYDNNESQNINSDDAISLSSKPRFQLCFNLNLEHHYFLGQQQKRKNHHDHIVIHKKYLKNHKKVLTEHMRH